MLDQAARLAALGHEQIVQPLDIDVIQTGPDLLGAPGTRLVVFARTAGRTLDRSGPFDVERITELLAQGLAFLAHLHDAGWRSGEPAGNDFVLSSGGLCLQAIQAPGPATHDRGPRAPDLAAPERRAGSAATIAADLYWLGALLRRLVLGPAPPGPLTRPLAQIIEPLLAEDPAARPSSAAAWAQERGLALPPRLAHPPLIDREALVVRLADELLTALRSPETPRLHFLQAPDRGCGISRILHELGWRLRRADVTILRDPAAAPPPDRPWLLALDLADEDLDALRTGPLAERVTAPSGHGVVLICGAGEPPPPSYRSWLMGRYEHRRHDLPLLSPDQAAALVRAALPHPPLPEPLARQLAARCRPLPGEILAALAGWLRGGALSAEAGTWRHQPLKRLRAETAIRGALLERLGRLTEGSRAVLERLAALGRSAPAAELRAGTSSAGPDDLSELLRRGWIKTRGAGADHEPRYRLARAALGQELLAALPATRRKTLFRRTREDLADILSVGEQGMLALGARDASWLRDRGPEAAGELESAGRTADARALYRRNARGRRGPAALEAALGAARCLAGEVDPVEATRILARLRREAPDGPRACEADYHEGRLALAAGEHDRAIRRLERARRQAPPQGEAARRIGQLLVAAHYRAKDLRAAAALAQAEIQACERDGADAPAGLLNTQALIAMEGGRHKDARAAYEKALERCRAQRQQDGEIHVLINLGLLEKSLGRRAEARARLEEALALARARGRDELEAMAQNNLGLMALVTGDLGEARERFELALSLRDRLGQRAESALALNNLGHVLLRAGQAQKAARLLEAAVRLLQPLGGDALAMALTTAAGIARERGRFLEARAFLEPALRLRRRIEQRSRVVPTLCEIAELELDLGQPAAATRMLREAQQRLAGETDPGPAILVALVAARRDLLQGRWPRARQALIAVQPLRPHPTLDRDLALRLDEAWARTELGQAAGWVPLRTQREVAAIRSNLRRLAQEAAERGLAPLAWSLVLAAEDHPEGDQEALETAAQAARRAGYALVERRALAALTRLEQPPSARLEREQRLRSALHGLAAPLPPAQRRALLGQVPPAPESAPKCGTEPRLTPPDWPYLGCSAGAAALRERAERLGATHLPVLITGETGTGKEQLARYLHVRSPRRERPWLVLAPGAIPAGLIESQLFGHVRGAFSGADRDHPGILGAADGGTILLDGLESFPPELQVKLLRVLEQGEIHPVGATAPRRLDIKILALATPALAQAVRAGQFREDLWFRLQGHPLNIPPLRQRPEDIPDLVRHFLDRLGQRGGSTPLQMADLALEVLQGRDWPGNVRELRLTVERAASLCRGDVILADDLPTAESPRRRGRPPRHRGAELNLARLERAAIREALRRHRALGRAAEALGIHPRTLSRKLKEFGIE